MRHFRIRHWQTSTPYTKMRRQILGVLWVTVSIPCLVVGNKQDDQANALLVALLDPEPAMAAYPDAREARSTGFGNIAGMFGGGGGGSTGGGAGSWLSSMFSGFSGVVDRVAQAIGAPAMPNSVKQALQDGPRSPVPAAGFQAPRMTRPGKEVFAKADARKRKVKGRARRSVPANAFKQFYGPKGAFKEADSPLAIEFKQVVAGLAKLFSGIGNLGSVPVSRMNQHTEKFKSSAGKLADKAADLPNAAFGTIRSKRDTNETTTKKPVIAVPVTNNDIDTPKTQLKAAADFLRDYQFSMGDFPLSGRQALGSVQNIPVPVDNDGKPVELIPVAVDENGHPVDVVPYPVDENGNPVETMPVDEKGRPVQMVPVDERGMPVDVQTVPVDRNGKPVEVVPVPVDERGRPVEFYPVDERGAKVEPVPVDENGRRVELVPVDERGNPVQIEQVPVDESGRPVEFVPVDESGRRVETVPVDEKGRPVVFVPVDERGRKVEPLPVDENERPVEFVPVDESGRRVETVPVDEKGRPVEFVPVDEKGRKVEPIPVDEKGRPVEYIEKSGRSLETIPVDEKGRPVEFVPVDEKGRPVKVETVPVDEKGRPVQFVPVDENGNPVEVVPVPVGEDGREVETVPVDEQGKRVEIIPVPVDRRGRPVAIVPVPVDERGNPVNLQKQGRSIETDPVPVDEHGNQVNIQPVVDGSGNPVEADSVSIDQNGRPMEFVPVPNGSGNEWRSRGTPPLMVQTGSVSPFAGAVGIIPSEDSEDDPIPVGMAVPFHSQEPAQASGNSAVSGSILRQLFKRAVEIKDEETPEIVPHTEGESAPKESDNEVHRSLIELAVAHQENWFTYLKSFNGSTLECHEWDFCRTARANNEFQTPVAKNGGKLLSYVTARLRDERAQHGERIIQAVDCCLSDDLLQADSCENYFYQKCLETDPAYALPRG